MSTSDVDTDPGRRQAADPRQEAPADLRLVPPALAAWAAAALALGAPGWWTAAGVVLCACAGLGFVVASPAMARRAGGASGSGTPAGSGAPPGRAGPAGRTGRLGGTGVPGPVRPPGEAGPAGRRGRLGDAGLLGRAGDAGLLARFGNAGLLGRAGARAGVAAGVLLCAAAGAAVAGLHSADVRTGPVPALALDYARVEAELTVTSDPRQTRPRVQGDHSTPVSLLLNAEINRLTAPDGSVTTLSTPVLVMVAPGKAAARWQRLLPSTGLSIKGRLAPPRHEGERTAAVLGTDAGEPPLVTAEPSTLQRAAGQLRSGLREATDGLGPDARALLPGLVVGDTSRVPPELHDAFRTTDLTHLLAVSGANLSILLFLLIGPPGTALRSERRGMAPRLGISLRTTAVTGGGIALAFVIVCRPEPSVLRAAACGLITLLAIGTGRRRSLIPALAAAVLLLVLYDPWLARSYGFLLSVLATGALLTIAPRWSGSLQRRGVPARLAEVLASAGAAQAVCAPVVVVLASRVGLVAIPCNLLAEFAVAPATVLGFAALAAAPVSMPVAQGLATVAGWPAGWIASVARTGAALPGAEVDWPGGWRGAALLAVLTAVLVLSARSLARHPWVCSAAVLLLVLAVLRPVPLTRLMTGWPPPGWAFALCDVGQGDAMVLAAGDGTGVVVDTGPEPRLVDRCLRDLGVTRVPLLLLTHFHADHVRGLPGVLRGREVGTIQTTHLDEPPEQAAFVRRTAEAAHVPMVRAVPGERRRAGPLDWQVLWPAAESWGKGSSYVAESWGTGSSYVAESWGTGSSYVGEPRGTGASYGTEEPNDSSVTLLVRSGGLTLLLLGDLEPPAQRGVLRGHPTLPRVDVLKVAHHGSAHQDPALLRSVRPRLALISCGADNPYGHPAARTVDALEAAGAKVLRTDTHGAIAVTGAGAGLRAAGRS
ncbi:ComEC/Rec2 family competence protein [Streptomyces sp. NBC_00059]|uniref:ComEC/Rec2 family competence protein n=1 Tax=Streptomyces sp. NBC_00059 TaxID=2975635 RepID=UPI00225647C6|nr:ComEC/Rec2 family competence protein [Streptomyces sp. NBC_00059]MCX5412655.1 ComEC/Rec2 family competence protein [Streptomyces sp. NBC_00059]